MPVRVAIPGPDKPEECRQLAETVADLHLVLGTVVEAGGELLPGEAVDEFTSAWYQSEPSLRQLAVNLVPPNHPIPFPSSPTPAPVHIPHKTLESGDLTGATGQAKRSALQRLKDRFFKYWYSLPRTDDKRAKAAEAAEGCLDLGATVVSSIPGYEKVVELLSLGKQLVGVRAKRGV